MVFYITGARVRPLLFVPCSPSPHTFTFTAHTCLWFVSGLCHPFPSSLHSPLLLTPRRQCFMLVIKGKKCCCTTGLEYVLHNVCQLSLTLSLTHSGLSLPHQFNPSVLSNESLPIFCLCHHTPPMAFIPFMPLGKITAAN